jgi:hypothetical protein
MQLSSSTISLNHSTVLMKYQHAVSQILNTKSYFIYKRFEAFSLCNSIRVRHQNHRTAGSSFIEIIFACIIVIKYSVPTCRKLCMLCTVQYLYKCNIMYIFIKLKSTGYIYKVLINKLFIFLPTYTVQLYTHVVNVYLEPTCDESANQPLSDCCNRKNIHCTLW